MRRMGTVERYFVMSVNYSYCKEEERSGKQRKDDQECPCEG